MPTFKEKSEVDDTRVKSRRDDDLGPKTGWNFRSNNDHSLAQPKPAVAVIICAL
jgi:hypothetical protein